MLENLILLSLIYIEHAMTVPTTEDCGISKCCFIKPPGCTNNCRLIHKWVRDVDGSFLFELNGSLDATTSPVNNWLAIGFSYDQNMGNDSVVLCRHSDELSINDASSYLNNVHMAPTISDPINSALGLSDVSITVDENYLICKFRRQNAVPLANSRYYNLTGQNYFILSAIGSLSGPTVQNHGPTNRFPGESATNFSATCISSGFKSDGK